MGDDIEGRNARLEARMVAHASFAGVFRRANGRLWRLRVVGPNGRVHFVGGFKTAKAAYAFAQTHVVDGASMRRVRKRETWK